MIILDKTRHGPKTMPAEKGEINIESKEEEEEKKPMMTVMITQENHLLTM
jgi:hypothetical protein